MVKALRLTFGPVQLHIVQLIERRPVRTLILTGTKSIIVDFEQEFTHEAWL